MKDFGLDEEQIDKVRSELVAKNSVGFEQLANQFSLDADKTESFKALAAVSTLEEWGSWIDVSNLQQRELFKEMQKLEKILNRNGLAEFIAYDLSFTSHMTYYTGLVFEIYGAGSGFPLGNGGRYDGLMKQFGMQVGATGFGLRVDRLLEVMAPSHENEEHTLILFEEQSEEPAHKKAEELRREGVRVTLQYAPAVQAIGEFSALFSNVIRMEGANNG